MDRNVEQGCPTEKNEACMKHLSGRGLAWSQGSSSLVAKNDLPETIWEAFDNSLSLQQSSGSILGYTK
ncbi:hypothetical protein HPP92_025300 [Vanilla planifolia]|uniref:Uncharacterized protein n=1 Tax=Vanilla planifolia TaxID=51239 RepID=A0A835UAW2_VANPL|nr:hypothetical protein HPP92_025300 [Vanilla planifolia]